MSEHTPEQASGSNAALGEGEPSMEDILASIRKIIADDADPVPLDGPSSLDADLDTDITTVSASDLAPVTIEPVHIEPVAVPDAPAAPDVKVDALDIDSLLSDLDVIEPEAPPAPRADFSPATEAAPSDDMIAELLDMPLGVEDDPVALDIPDIPEDATPIDATSLGERAAQSFMAEPPIEAAAVAAVAPVAADDPVVDDELDLLMDELLTDLDDASPADDIVVDPAADLLDDTADLDADLSAGLTDDRALPEMETGEDMDLVRSLMEDLTDADVDGAAEDSPAALDDAALDDAALNNAAMDDTDVLDDILEMTLDDEVAEQPLDIPTPEPEIVQVDDLQTPALQGVDAEPVPSLSDIAASAEADAKEASVLPTAAAATVAGAALLGGATRAAAPEPVAEPEPASELDRDAEHTEQQTPPMETPMPRAVRSDAILDEVTEEATMSAFAELNQVVEEKAVYSERGPRIGDLVQEALKPMLKEWLDANLKGIVERAVAKEVKRLSTGK